MIRCAVTQPEPTRDAGMSYKHWDAKSAQFNSIANWQNADPMNPFCLQ